MRGLNEKILKVAIEAALEAGRLQTKYLGRAHRVRFKGEINIVTEVDTLCEDRIMRRIRRTFPSHDILTEESGAFNRPSEYKWIIDPLDGTVNYAHGYPLFCVSIGVEHRGRLIAGVVFEPNRGELFRAVAGGGAFRNDRRILVSGERRLKRSLLATGFAYNVTTKLENNINHFRNFIMKAQAVRRDGVAAVDLCYVACGRYEGFWELGLCPWDVAAAALIVQEAGGSVSLFDGAPLNIYKNEICASNGKIHRPMLEVIRRGRRRP